MHYQFVKVMEAVDLVEIRMNKERVFSGNVSAVADFEVLAGPVPVAVDVTTVGGVVAAAGVVDVVVVVAASLASALASVAWADASDAWAEVTAAFRVARSSEAKV